MSKFKSQEHCQWCGANPDQVVKMVESDGGLRICAYCINTAFGMVQESLENEIEYSAMAKAIALTTTRIER